MEADLCGWEVDKWDAIVDSGRTCMEDFPARFSTGWVEFCEVGTGGGIGFGRKAAGRAAGCDGDGFT